MYAITGAWHWIRGYLHGHTLILKLDLFVEILCIVSTEGLLATCEPNIYFSGHFCILVFVLR